MSDISIRTFTIRDLVNSRDELDKLTDPQGRLSTCNDDWVRLLASNPNSAPDDIALILAIDAGQVIGRLGLYAGVLQCGGVQERIFYGSGFGLDQDYRASGAGGMLFLRAVSSGAAFLASGDPDENCQRLYRAARASNVGPLRCFLYFYDVSVVIKRFTSNALFRLLVSFPLAFLLRAFYVIRDKVAGPSAALEFVEVESFTQSIDVILDADQRCLLRRDANTLNWVLANRQGSAYEVRSEGKLIGYCILAHGTRAVSSAPRQADGSVAGATTVKFGYLLDYYLSDRSKPAAASLIRFCVGQFRGKVDVFECQCVDHNVEAVCRDVGFHERTGMKQFLKPRRGATHDAHGNWFLTLGAGDVMLFY